MIKDLMSVQMILDYTANELGKFQNCGQGILEGLAGRNFGNMAKNQKENNEINKSTIGIFRYLNIYSRIQH